ncbi:unnamed protein product [Calypogeia fissa]
MARSTAELQVDGREWSLSLGGRPCKRLRTGGFFAGFESKEDLKKELYRQVSEQEYGEKLWQTGCELGAANKHIQTLEENLASERRTVRQKQALVDQLVSNEKLTASLLAREAELAGFRDQILQLEREMSELVCQVPELKLQLEQANQEKHSSNEKLEASLLGKEIELQVSVNQILSMESERSELVHQVQELKFQLDQADQERYSSNEKLKASSLAKEVELAASRDQILRLESEKSELVQTLEDDLASERRTVQQLQQSLTQLVEGARVSNEKLQTVLLLKQADFLAYRDEIRLVESEKVKLANQIKFLQFRLDSVTEETWRNARKDSTQEAELDEDSSEDAGQIN